MRFFIRGLRATVAATIFLAVQPVLAQDASPRAALLHAFERDAAYAVDGFAFTADLTLRVRARGRDAEGHGRADYDPRAPEGERWTMHEITVMNADGSPIDGEDRRQEAYDAVRATFNDGLTRIGLDLREDVDRVFDAEWAGDGAVRFRLKPEEGSGKDARRAAENSVRRAEIDGGCITAVERKLEKSYKPSVISRTTRRDAVFTYACPADGPAHLATGMNMTEGMALGGDFLIVYDLAFSNVRYVGAPNGEEAGGLAADDAAN